MKPSMKNELQMKVSRDDVYVNIELNRDRWRKYLQKGYNNVAVYPDFSTWARNPQSQFQIRVVKRRKVLGEVEVQKGFINIIVPNLQSCDLSVKSSEEAEIKNFYRELFVIPPVRVSIKHCI